MQTGLKAVIIRELKRIQSESIYLWLLFILPLFTFLLFTTMFSQGKANNYYVALHDADNTELSRKVISWIEATPEIEFHKKVNSLQEGKELIEKGNVFAVLEIPKGFEAGIYSGKPKKIILFYSNSNLSAGSGVSTAVLKTIKTMSAGVNLQKRMSKNKEIFEQALNNVQPIRLSSHALYNPFINYSYYLVTGLLPVMLLMFILSTTIYVVGSELKEHTALEWFNTSGKSMIVALTGKLLPYSIVFIIEAFFMNTILFKVVGAPQNGNIFVIFTATIFFVYAYQAMGVFLISVFPNMRLSLSLGAAYASLAFSFAGLTYPIIAMSKFMQGFAQIFPFTHYLKIYINEAMKGLDLYYSVSSFLILSAFIVLPFLLIPRLRAFATKEKYWGKS